MTPAAPGARELLAQRLRDLMASYQVREVRMFGALSFMVDERMAVAAGRDGDLLVRCRPAEYDELIRRGGVPAMMGDDRPMGPGWITVPGQRISGDTELAYWIAVGIDSRNASD